MRSYGQYRPVAKASELLGDRWVILLIREMLYGPHRFNDLERGLPGISRSVLSSRLKRLQRDGIIERVDGAYRFTEAGEQLRPVVQAMGDWVAGWVMADPTPAELDPELLMLFISRHLDREAIPDERTVLEFDFVGEPARRLWMTIDRVDVSVCHADPLLPIDLIVRSTVHDLYRVYVGRATLGSCLEHGAVQLIGLPAMERRFVSLMRWSSFAPASTRRLSRSASGGEASDARPSPSPHDPVRLAGP